LYNLVAADAELAQVAANGLRDYASLSEQEKVRFVATFMSFLSYSQNAFLKWREGLLKPALWLGWEQVMMNLFGAPGGKALWKERSYLFWRGISPIHRERSYEKTAASRRETAGRLQYWRRDSCPRITRITVKILSQYAVGAVMLR